MSKYGNLNDYLLPLMFLLFQFYSFFFSLVMTPGTSVVIRCYSLEFFDAFRCSVDDNARPFELEIIHNYCLGNVRRSNWLYFDLCTHSILFISLHFSIF